VGLHGVITQNTTIGTIYKIYFKLSLALNAEQWTLRKRNKNKIQAMDMKVLRYIEGETRRRKTRSYIFREKVGIWKLIDLNEKLLQWFGHARRVNE
jgi:hypothetical protein